MADRPLIVTALLDPATQDGFNALRARHFPAERNHLAAHLTLFHHLDPAGQAEIDVVLANAATRLPLTGRTGPPRNLGGGVAIGIDCPELAALRQEIARQVPGPLTKQDQGWGWAHVTVQNKVDPRTARELTDVLGAAHTPRPLQITGLGLWRYLGGPWEPLGSYPPPGQA